MAWSFSFRLLGREHRDREVDARLHELGVRDREGRLAVLEGLSRRIDHRAVPLSAQLVGAVNEQLAVDARLEVDALSANDDRRRVALDRDAVDLEFRNLGIRVPLLLQKLKELQISDAVIFRDAFSEKNKAIARIEIQ